MTKTALVNVAKISDRTVAQAEVLKIADFGQCRLEDHKLETLD
ncbi:MAG: hypothetical protein ACK4QL_00020 [Pseudanabaenaceae cyanobacterium]